MVYLLRHAVAVIVLPVTVTILVPRWIVVQYGVNPTWPATPAAVSLVLAGVAVLGLGLALFSASLFHFFTEGRGTLAPWDPPRRLVVRGPYRYVRNPMISGVIFILAGEALVLRSVPHAWWAALFAGLNAIVIPLTEEPFLEQRFGDDYRLYRQHVRRFVPRWSPWSRVASEGRPSPVVDRSPGEAASGRGAGAPRR
jgi:protein-S-isoprenylcysteine O-methyltransferase Ste14